ncbi:DHA2 family efflux MFS transporter permease subunit [Ktedonosporobacter rubrisoli]|uniref:DHA2 family efflux MFS transporter permease subunit n=1 Tax=Ktedonosporobacter rubrisoli TaxID=2509675 RepID=A0A4P6K310_KTERU|nr:MFS transporter [Ktedonosporobacter rubrisoli]QBD82628.1 DHA2 family efflux MFS transporter permease subunit [Ktedonosporobacter rubrisoli]
MESSQHKQPLQGALSSSIHAALAHTSEAAEQPRSWLVLALLCSMQFILILDTAIVIVGLPSIQRELGFDSGTLQWVVTGYSLAFGGFLLLGSRASDLFGRRFCFWVGLIIFTLASLLGGIAQSQIMLVGGRLLQGLGAAIISPAALALLMKSFAEGRERNRALGVWGAASAGGGAAGIIVGSLLTELSWRWVFLVNVPIGIAAIVLVPLALSESRGRTQGRLDLPGALLITASLIGLVYGLSEAANKGFAEAGTLVPLVGGIGLLIVFLILERRTQEALIPLHIFRRRTLVGGNLVAMLMLAILSGETFFLTLYLQQVRGSSPLEAGLAFLPQTLLIMVFSNAAARLVSHLGMRKMLIGAMVLLAAGAFLFVRLGTEGDYLSVVLPATLLLALGLGGGFVAASIAATTGVGDSDQGLASGLFNTVQQVGAAVGIAVLVTVATAHTAHPGQRDSVVIGYHWAFIAATIFALVALLVALIVVRAPDLPGDTSNISRKEKRSNE